MVAGLTAEQLQAVTGATLHVPADVAVLEATEPTS
jgi:hypothetical protein